MFILHVQITVKPECREEFLKEITTFAKACT